MADIRHVILRCWGLRLLAAGTPLLLASGASFADPRPLIVVFAAPAPAPPGAGRDKEAEKAAALLPSMAMRAVRDRLKESALVDTLSYQPDDPTFVRAVAENKLRINAAEPGADDRIALGKAVGASYVIVVKAERNKEGAVVLNGEATDVKTRRAWMDTEHASIQHGLSPVGATVGSPFSDDMLTTANMFVMKFFSGPLGTYTKAAPSGSLVVPVPATNPPMPAAPVLAAVVTPPRNPDEAARPFLQQGEALLTANDVNGAIAALRQAVNQSPRSTPARVALTRAYLAAGRGLDAVAEVRRALPLLPSSDIAGQVALTRLMAQGLTQSGDTGAARAAYQQIVAAQPQALWARLGLADMLMAEGKTDEAEAQYRAVRKADPANAEAAGRLARLRAGRDDYAGALAEMSALDPQARYSVVRDLFDGGALAVAGALTRERRAFDGGQIQREAFYKAASAQADRVNALLTLLQGAAPVGSAKAAESSLRAYRRRVFAASLLSQAAAGILSFLENDDSGAGSQASVLLSEARKEIAEAQTVDNTAAEQNKAAQAP